MPSATSYNTAGNREDLTNIISMVDPQKTPLYSTLSKGPIPKALFQEWQVDNLEDPKFPGIVDGSDVDSFENNAKNRARVGNRIQEFRRPYKVTRLQEMVETAGVPSEYGRSKTKAVTQIKIDIESAIGSDNDLQVGDGAQANKLRALGKWIDSSNNDIPEIARTPSGSEGTTSTTTESTFNAVLQSAYEASGDETDFTLYANTTLKKKISDFTRVQSDGSNTPNPYRVNENATTKTVTLSVMFYNSDWGTVKVVTDLFLGRTDGGGLTTASKQRGYLIAPNMVSLGFMQNPRSEEFDDQGGGRRGMVSSVLTLCVKNPKALGKFSG